MGQEKGMTEADLVSLIEQDRVDLEADSVREPGDSADLVSGQGKLLKWDTAYLSAVAELQGVQISLGVKTNWKMLSSTQRAPLVNS